MLPKPTIKTLNGWLSTDGRLYPCEPGGHDALAQKIVSNRISSAAADFNPQRVLERSGWAKLTTDGKINLSNWAVHRRGSGELTINPEEMTNSQFSTVTEWHEYHHRKTAIYYAIERMHIAAKEDPNVGFDIAMA